MKPTQLWDGTQWIPSDPPIVMCASLSATTPFGVDSVIIYDVVQFDTASAYNSATGLFTAPSDGYYEVSQNSYIAGTSDAQFVQKNGLNRYAFLGYAEDSPLYFGSGSITLYLVVGDTVSVNAENGTIYLGNTNPTLTVGFCYMTIKKIK